MALRNVARLKILCPICGHNDWCMVSDDRKLALCQRIQNDHPNKKGGWWHSLEDRITANKEDFTPRIEKPRGPEELIHAVYSDLFRQFPLSAEHLETLKQRGLTVREIREQGYGTLPINNRHQVSKMLLEKYGEVALSSVPGFYMKEGPYGEYWTIFGGTGFMIPILSVDRKITGIQVRVDRPTGKTKYIWLSTDGKKQGTNSGNPVHVAIPPSIQSNDIWITEGPLKANVIAWRNKCVALAAPGVAHWQEIPNLLSQLRKLLVNEGRNIIAYDSSEFASKPWVKQYAVSLAEELNRRQLPPIFALWDLANGKGIDDVILSGNETGIEYKLS
ncbi:DUF3854 domain-containing protein [Cohnella sp. CFH 77786]|uniref:DUF3854 domain-containing protein n=1 Tax=Cohnella sp. CFH 77786 TaxID=2662265 RepID=UPI001C60B7E9|nr:DUF3854 domain-containing protein [Cohnella sp. CFH 77786]MBW5449346.1 DUF3854 domain-containing protein [Cohnella sp. CFH 77786]